MKNIVAAAITMVSVAVFAQNEVKVTEETQSFSVGSKNCIVVSIPYGKTDIVEKELKSQMKDWGGKYNSSKGEYTVSQGTLKAMGDKPFDGYAKIIPGEGNALKVAVAVDLGGAYMSSRDHSAQHSAMSKHLKEFALKTAQTCVAEELKTEQKTLSTFEKEQKDLEKDKEDLLKSIEDYKKRITEAEKKIEENGTNQTKKKEEIANQTKKVSEVESKGKNLR